MSDWTKQTEELVNTFSNAQKKLWDGWFKAVESATKESPIKSLEDERLRILDTWQTSVKQGLETQAECLRAWADGVGVAPGADEWAKQSQEVMTRWAATQEEFLDSCFDAARKVDTSGVDAAWQTQGKKALEACREATDQGVKAQQDLTALWTEAAGQQQKAAKKQPAGKKA